MVRTTGSSTVGKRHKVKPVSLRQRRKHMRRSQVRIGRKTIEVRKAVSQRARTHPMEHAPFSQPQTPQDLLMASTAIKKFKYTFDKLKEGFGRLRIWFVKGQVYDYANVPESVVMSLAQAQSKGRYFYYNIRLEYDYKRVR